MLHLVIDLHHKVTKPSYGFAGSRMLAISRKEEIPITRMTQTGHVIK